MITSMMQIQGYEELGIFLKYSFIIGDVRSEKEFLLCFFPLNVSTPSFIKVSFFGILWVILLVYFRIV